MKVSIVIPVYNVEKYLRICLDSVRAQEFTDFEVILVDDGSQDGSLAICNEYAKKDGRFKVIRQENSGPSRARNTGVKAASGDYVYFLDSDDCVHPLLLLKMTDLASEYDAALVQVDVERVSQGFTDYGKEVDSDFKVYFFDTVDAFYNLDRDDKSITQDIRLITLVAWTKLYRRDLAEKVTFPEGLRLHEDQMVAHRFIVEGGGIVFCRAPLYYYRNRKGSLITEGWTVKRLAIFDCYKDRLEWARKIQGDRNRVQDLVYYIYVRYLVCMFKNYWMITKNLSGECRKQYQKQVAGRFCRELKAYGIALKPKDWFVFHCFGIMPGFFTGCYQTVQNLKTRLKQ